MSALSLHPGAQRAVQFARSEVFERTYREGMALVEEAAAYLDGPGRAASKALPRALALVYAGESMRLTTRLMQVASWLLVQRAVRDGEIAVGDASQARYRLGQREERPAGEHEHDLEAMPAQLRDLAARGAAIYDRVRRLDDTMYGDAGEPGVNALEEQWARLVRVFGEGA